MQGLEGLLKSSRDNGADSAGHAPVRRSGNGPSATRNQSGVEAGHYEARAHKRFWV